MSNPYNYDFRDRYSGDAEHFLKRSFAASRRNAYEISPDLLDLHPDYETYCSAVLADQRLDVIKSLPGYEEVLNLHLPIRPFNDLGPGGIWIPLRPKRRHRS